MSLQLRLNLSREEKKNPPQIAHRWDLKVGDTVEVISTVPATESWKRYYGFNLVGKEGKVIEHLIGKDTTLEGARVKFPSIEIVTEESRETRPGFEYAFYQNEIRKVGTEIEIKDPGSRHYLKGKALKARREAVRKLREEGKSIRELAKQFEASRRTILRWLKG